MSVIIFGYNNCTQALRSSGEPREKLIHRGAPFLKTPFPCIKLRKY